MSKKPYNNQKTFQEQESEPETVYNMESAELDESKEESQEETKGSDMDANEEKAHITSHNDEKLEDNEIVDELGVISKDTKITGDIITQGHLSIFGEVQGNIKAKGNVFANGIINGDIICDNLKLAECDLKANLCAKHSIAIEADTKVDGSVDCDKIMVNGMVKGDITAVDAVIINSNAKICGDITARSMSIEHGAEIQGYIKITKEL